MKKIKYNLFFWFANYFLFWAKIKLNAWKPLIVVITGSNGKTTTLNMAEAQFGARAKYSHHANSVYGIPYDILNLHRTSYSVFEWIYLFLAAPFKAYEKPFKEKIYFVEADCDRPREGQVLSQFLKQDITIWLSSGRTHSLNYGPLVASGKFKNIEEAVAYEFGYHLANTKELAFVNTDNELIKKQISRTQAKIVEINSLAMGYEVSGDGTNFDIDGKKVSVKYLLPQESEYSIRAIFELAKHLDQEIDYNFKNLDMPPGRSSIFKGVKDLTLIDSTYNANYFSVKAILNMVSRIKNEKWLVLGDMIEQGSVEKEEHEKLVPIIEECNFYKVILVGPRMKKYVLPKLDAKNTLSVLEPYEALQEIEKTVPDGMTIVFKGARFLEGVVEKLLLDKSNIKKLCRQEENWKKTRKKWGV